MAWSFALFSTRFRRRNHLTSSFLWLHPWPWRAWPASLRRGWAASRAPCASPRPSLRASPLALHLADRNDVLGGDPVLLSAGLDDCEHLDRPRVRSRARTKRPDRLFPVDLRYR